MGSEKLEASCSNAEDFRGYGGGDCGEGGGGPDWISRAVGVIHTS